MKYLIIFLLLASTSIFAAERVKMPDGNRCWFDGKRFYGCSNDKPKLSETYNNAPPDTCMDLNSRINTISNNLRRGVKGKEYQRQKSLRRQYEDLYRSECE